MGSISSSNYNPSSFYSGSVSYLDKGEKKETSIKKKVESSSESEEEKQEKKKNKKKKEESSSSSEDEQNTKKARTKEADVQEAPKKIPLTTSK